MAFDPLKVWSIKPDWSDGISETLDWLNSVLTSPTGAEQRIKLRSTPRRSFEMSFKVFGRERAYLDTLLGAIGVSDFYMPFWYDIGRLDSSAGAGSTILRFDTQYIEYINGNLVYLQGPDAFTYEIAQIHAFDSESITLESGLTVAWPKGTKVYPVGRMFVDDFKSSVTNMADRDFSTRIRFNVNTSNPSDSLVFPTTYRDYPVLEDEPNFRDNISRDFSRLFNDIDGQTGRRLALETSSAEFTGQQFAWQATGRAAQSRLRSLFYALAGRRTPLWLPTFMADFDLAAAAGPSDTTLTVAHCGFSDLAGLKTGRQDIQIIRRKGSPIYRAITDADNSGSNEVLTLDAPVGSLLTPDTVKRISFVSLNRLDQDTVEWTHHTDSIGTSSVSVVFKSTPENRSIDV